MSPTDAYHLLLFTVLSIIALAGSTAIVWAVMAFREWQQVHGHWGR